MTVSQERFDELLTVYIEGDVSQTKLDEIADAVRHSPDFRQRFQQQTRLNAMLREIAAEHIELQSVQTLVPLRDARSLAWSVSRISRIVAGLVAAIALVSGFWFLRSDSSQGNRVIVGRCFSVSGTGDASIRLNDWERPLSQTTKIRVGDQISCGSGAQAMLRLNDGSILAMEPGATLLFESAQPRVRLQSGEVLFEVASRERDSLPFQVETSESTVDVLGTIFSLNSDLHTELTVYEGEVTLTRHRDQASINVASQQRANTAGSELSVQDLGGETSKNAVSVLSLLPTDDITLDRKRVENNSHLKVEQGRRVVLMRFEIPEETEIRSARLRLTQHIDAGAGTLRLHVADPPEWNEMQVKFDDSTSRPRQLLATRIGAVGRGQVIELVIDEQIGSGPLSLIMTLEGKGEDDIWFASRQTDTPPQLLLTLDSD